jgi:hypothetical protein
MRKMGGISSAQDVGSSLSYLHIVNIKINIHAWKAVAKGLIAESCVLKKLRINIVEFTREELSALAEGLSINQSIETLDLSYNDLKDSYGDILARIVSKQMQSRDEIKFKRDLRHVKDTSKSN